MALKPCRECGAQVSTEAEVCPHCGVRTPTATDPIAVLGPSDTKQKHKSKKWIIIASILGFIFVWGLLSDKTPNDSKTTNSATTKSAHRCAVGTSVSGRVLVNKRDVPMMSGPSAETGHVFYDGVTGMGEKYRLDVSLSPFYDLEAICVLGDWLQVRIVAIGGRTKDQGKPMHLETGWVERRFIAEPTDDQKHGLFWDIENNKDIPPADKDWVRIGALRVLSDNKECKRIDNGSLDKNRIYVGCDDLSENGIWLSHWSVSFDRADVLSGKPIVPPTPYDEAASRKMCNEAIMRKANFPSTVVINSHGRMTINRQYGNRGIFQSFTAKNTYGLELTYNSRCLITPDGKLEIEVTEKNAR